MAIINFENLGNIEKGTVELNNFTIFTGSNNTGKTYATYAIYSLLDKDFKFRLTELDEIINILYKEGFYTIDLINFFDRHYLNMKQEIEKDFSKSLSFIFSATDDEFKNSKVSFDLKQKNIKESLQSLGYIGSVNIGKKDTNIFEITKEENNSLLKLVLLDNTIPKRVISNNIKIVLSQFLFNKLFSDTFLLPAERTGLNLFYQELSSNRTTMFHHLKKSEVDIGELIKDLVISKYPQPIADYIDFLNRTYQYKKNSSSFKDLAQEIKKELIKGRYEVDKDGIYFLPYKKDSNKKNYTKKISLHLTSSTVKTFFSLVFYLEHLAQKDDTLIIDEPELNLHPDNQRKIARILSMIANRGIKVIVSTHSDYFIREINNLIMLSEDFESRDELLKKYQYNKKMLVPVNKLNAYLFEDNTIKKMETTLSEGIIATTFDDAINGLNESNDEIYYQKEADLSDD